MTGPFIHVATPVGVRALFTRRHDALGDFSFGGASSEGVVTASRERLAAEFGVTTDRLVVNRQVHGDAVRRVPNGATNDRADALVTNVPGWVLMALAADCVPVLVWRRDGSAVGAAHAGWRGLLAGVVEALVTAVGGGAGLAAAIGPSIGACCYPVDSALRDRFRDRFGAQVVRDRAIDLPLATRVALEGVGVDGDAVSSSARCTRCTDGEFFSHRRDGEAAGRQAGAVMITPRRGS
ncbi:MAG: laccase domain-containing protein [Actinobacteria bacterium]|nr:laccase domain-containing protein [Actinomycetota bacterium]